MDGTDGTIDWTKIQLQQKQFEQRLMAGIARCLHRDGLLTSAQLALLLEKSEQYP